MGRKQRADSVHPIAPAVPNFDSRRPHVASLMNATINPGVSNAAVRQGGLSASVPVLFLPVNIETRFMTSATGAPELWVRMYPDQIAIDSHEPELTAQEVIDGRVYWDAVWRAGNPPVSLDTVKAPWRGLAAR